MADNLLETIATVRAEEAAISKLYGGEGTRVRGRRKADAQYQRALLETLKLITAGMEGDHRAAFYLKEAMTSADFPQLFGDVLDRKLLADYRDWTSTYPGYVDVNTSIPDFRDVKRFRIDGAEATLDVVTEQEEYPEASLTDDVYTYSVSKYGRRLPFSFEAIINDDLGGLKKSIERLARAARRTEEKFAANLFVGSAGPDGTVFSVGNANIVTSNPVLSIAGLQTAMTVLGSQTDSDGEPIVIEEYALVVPVALEVTAQNILNAATMRITTAGGATGQELETTNWMKGRVQLFVNPYLSVIPSSNGTTSWYLIANPSNGRPFAEVGFLRGHAEPELFMKSPNAERVGGGGADPLAGDFDTDSVEYKVRHILGGSILDPKMAVASNGSGS